MCGFEGGESIVSTSMLTESQAVNLLSVDFLCQLCQQTDKSLHTDCIVTDLVKLSDCDDKDAWSSNKAFDVHLVSMTECVLQLHLSLIATFLHRNFVRCLTISYFYTVHGLATGWHPAALNIRSAGPHLAHCLNKA